MIVSAQPTYLDRIVPAVRRRVEERKSRVSEAELAVMDAPEARASFASAVAAPGLSLIAEVKRASPSKGPIRPDLEVGGIVRAYEAGGARAISVLTEEDYFRGSLEDLRLAAAETRLPLLRKDFVVDVYQVYEARVWGASAVLLIAALLSDDELARLAEASHQLGLDVLLEVHDDRELSRALKIEKVIIGVNNRDLRTFEVSLETTERLACLVPPERLLVGESGIWNRADVERLSVCGVDAVLVGESILRDPDVGEAARRLTHPAPVVADRPFRQASRKETE